MLTAAVLLLMSLAFANWWLEGDPLAQLPLQLVLATERDDHGFVSHAARNYGQPGRPAIAVIGTSALREGLQATPIMERLVKERFGQTATFRNLSTFDQTLTETLALASTIPINADTVLVIEIKPRRLAHEADQLRGAYSTPRLIGVRDEAVFDFLRKHDLGSNRIPALWRYRTAIRHYLNGRLDHRFRSRLADLVTMHCGAECVTGLVGGPWLRTPRRYLQFAYPDLSLPQERLKRLQQKIASTRIPEFHKNHALGTTAAGGIIEAARAKGATVLLMEPPRHPYSIEAYAAIDPLYRGDIAALTKSGAKYIDLSKAAAIGPESFYDLDHLRPAGRSEFSRLFVRTLETALNGR
jgi:hypothetical protein